MADLCPFCNGGDNLDRRTFYLGIENGLYQCKRGGCAEKGRLEELAKIFGEDIQTSRDMISYAKTKKAYDFPDQELLPLTDEILNYFTQRKISKETLEDFGIGANSAGDIVFPFYKDGTLVYVKYRKPRKPMPKERKEWQFPNTMPILFGMDMCSFSKALHITEGQLDAMSLYESGIPNVVSVPCGCDNLEWVDNCWDWLEKFHKIVLFGDADDPGLKMVETLAKRLGEERVSVVRTHPKRPNGDGVCKDANEILYFYGPEAIQRAVDEAEPYPVKGIIDLSDVTPVDPTLVERIKTMIPLLDESIGGLAEGGITILTGKAGNGKLLADETPVMTRNGWKNHGDLVVGDEVVGLDGQYVKVTHIFPKGEANMCVTFTNGEQIYCHENHEWVLERHSDVEYKHKVYETKTLYDIFHNPDLRKWRGRGDEYKYRLPCRSAMVGEHKDLPIKPYTLGVWLGDGRSSNPDITTPNSDLAIIRSIIEDDHYEMSWSTIHKTTGVGTYGFKDIRKPLQIFNMCHSRKKTPKHIPEIYLTADYNQRMELLAGLLDTDGCLYKGRTKYIYSTTEQLLRDGIIELISTFGWRVCVQEIPPRTSSSGIVGRKTVWAIGFSPTENIPCRVERKKMKAPASRRRISFKSIEKCVPVTGNCIEVEGGVYCVGKTMLPTHNSTLNGQLLLNAIEQGYSVCAYSGELRKEKFQEWIHLQCAGSDYITLKYDHIRGKDVPLVPYPVQEKIREYYRGKFYLFDNNEIFEDNQAKAILKVFTMAVRRYGCKLFLVDNMMTSLSDADEEMRAQSMFVNALKKFATRYNVHVLIVAHPRKTKQGEQLGNDDVSGTSAIGNLADNIIVVEKPNLRITKNREDGINRLIECCYAGDSRRIYQANSGDLFKYSWDKTGIEKVKVRADSKQEYGIQISNQNPF